MLDLFRPSSPFILRARGVSFSPLSLFAASEPGVWLDPSDLMTLYQDAAGTQPVTAPGQSVGRVLDKSGMGFHATQATAAAMPTYGVEPSRGRVNLLTRTGFDGAVSGTPGTAPTDWPAVSTGGTITFTAGAASLGGGTLRVAVANNRHFFNRSITLAATGTWTTSVDLFVTDNGSNTLRVGQLLRQGAAPADATYEYTLNGSVVAETAIVPLGVNRLLWRVTTTGTGGALAIRFGLGSGMNVTGDVTFSNIQFELGSTATPYQRVGSAFDVTEAGVPSLSYLSFDGVDDFLVTPTITPSIDKVQMFAGVRKLSDAAIGVLAETSTNSGGNNGAFGVTSPAGAGSPSYLFQSRGTAIQQATYTNAAIAAPNTSVLTGFGDIAGDIAALRVNGSQVAQSTSDQGTGNYLTYPLYIGRRAGAALPFNGRIYGLIVRFGANLTADQITQTEAWLNSKTGAF